MKPKFQVISTKNYFNLLKNNLLKVKKLFLVQSLYFEIKDSSNDIISDIYKHLTSHQNKDKVPMKALIIDDFSLSSLITKPRSKQVLTYLLKKQVALIINHMPWWQKITMPYIKRNHIKISLLDNLACFGGINLSSKETKYHDLMICSKNKKVRSFLKKVIHQSIAQNLRGKLHKLDSQNHFIIDHKKRQLSYACANFMIKKATKNIFFVSQFPPDHKISWQLKNAVKKKVKVTVITPRKNNFNLVFYLIHKLNTIYLKLTAKELKLIQTPFMVHAKLIIVDDKLVLVGSANMHYLGTVAQTSNLMLLSYDKDLVKQVNRFIKKLIKP